MRNILLVDDHPLVRLGIRQALVRIFGQINIGEAQTAREALDIVQKSDWEVVLLDIELPDRSGLDILMDIKKFKPKLPVLFISGKSETEFAMRALRGGASGFISKLCSQEELATAIRKAASGEKYLSPSLAEKLALSSLGDTAKPPHTLLSEREFQVLRLIGSGKTLTDIATELSLSVKTVSTYRTRLLEKMQMNNNAELARYAIKNGLVD